jgi:hypothetical protein
MTPSIVGQQSPVKLTTAHAVLELHVADTMAKSLGAIVGVVNVLLVLLLLVVVALLSLTMSRSAGVGGMARKNGAIVGILVVIFIIIIIGTAVVLLLVVFVVLVGSNSADVSLVLPVAGVVPGAKVNGAAIVGVGRTTVGDDVVFMVNIMNGVGAAVKFVIPAVSLVGIVPVVVVFVVIGGSSGVVPFVAVAMTGGNVLGVDGSATPPLPLPPCTTGALVG